MPVFCIQVCLLTVDDFSQAHGCGDGEPTYVRYANALPDAFAQGGAHSMSISQVVGRLIVWEPCRGAHVSQARTRIGHRDLSGGHFPEAAGSVKKCPHLGQVNRDLPTAPSAPRALTYWPGLSACKA